MLRMGTYLELWPEIAKKPILRNGGSKWDKVRIFHGQNREMNDPGRREIKNSWHSATAHGCKKVDKQEEEKVEPMQTRIRTS